MKVISNLILALVLITPGVTAYAHEKTGEYCSELKGFMTSVKPDETREITLRTFWGAREEGGQLVMGSKTCEHNDYDPGKKLCAYLIEHSSTEFAGANAKRILNCLASKPAIGKHLDIHSGSFATTFGSQDRGVLVNLDLLPDKEPGEMVLRLQVLGY
ncbi:hypothetical protein [Stenotrophomonas sp.]|uniref:hypothetical protein n=1 Tax=Stenotrophomonas sp. TaxID=69392 RepID=UPI0028B0FB37|nr:hypothetical protein [Stenotrophomonas sp.]